MKPSEDKSETVPPLWPKVGSAALVYDGDYVLLGQRGKEPNRGRWVMPGGKVEWGETIDAAAVREVREETGLDVEIVERLGIFEIVDPAEHSVFVLSLAKPVGGTLKAGDDISAVQWVSRFLLSDIDLSDPCREALVEVGWTDNGGVQHG